MSQIVILTGSHGTGKTAVAQVFAEKTGLPFYQSQAAEAHVELGFLPSEDLDITKRMKVQNNILSRWMRQFELARVTGGIFDRCPLDFASYLLGDITRTLDPRLSIVAEDYVECCIGIARTLPNVFLCEPHGQVIGDRGILKPDAENRAYARHIQTLVVGLIADGGISHDVVGPGTVGQRVDYIGRSLSASFDAAAAQKGRPSCPTQKLS